MSSRVFGVAVAVNAAIGGLLDPEPEETALTIWRYAGRKS